MPVAPLRRYLGASFLGRLPGTVIDVGSRSLALGPGWPGATVFERGPGWLVGAAGVLATLALAAPAAWLVRTAGR